MYCNKIKKILKKNYAIVPDNDCKTVFLKTQIKQDSTG